MIKRISTSEIAKEIAEKGLNYFDDTYNDSAVKLGLLIKCYQIYKNQMFYVNMDYFDSSEKNTINWNEPKIKNFNRL